MTSGVVTIVEDASLRVAYRALARHGVHAVLVVGRTGGKPLGWVTARGMLAWLESPEHAFLAARDAITEQPETISPSATAREALGAGSGRHPPAGRRPPPAFPGGRRRRLRPVRLAAG